MAVVLKAASCVLASAESCVEPSAAITGLDSPATWATLSCANLILGQAGHGAHTERSELREENAVTAVTVSANRLSLVRPPDLGRGERRQLPGRERPQLSQVELADRGRAQP